MKCCFIGHRDCTEELYDIIYREIKKLMAMRITDFYSGGMGNFDKMCEKAVKKLGGHLTFVPYNIGQIKEKDKLWYDDIICPFGDKKYSKFDIPDRNKWLVDNCGLCLVYVCKDGGARRTLNYAYYKERQIINIHKYL